MNHISTLDNYLYHPDSPVTLLLTRRLAEKYIDLNRNPDEQTQIESRYSTHTLTWAFGNFQKTFPTPISGLPELLFDEGFRSYTSFCKQVRWHATTDDEPCGSYIISFDDDEVQPGTDEDDTNKSTCYLWSMKNRYFQRWQRNYMRGHLPWICSNRWDIDTQDKNLEWHKFCHQWNPSLFPRFTRYCNHTSYSGAVCNWTS